MSKLRASAKKRPNKKYTQKMVTLKLADHMPEQTAPLGQWLSHALQRAGTGNSEEAILIVKLLIQHCPKYIELYTTICQLYIRAGRYLPGVEYIEKALSIDGNDLQVLFTASALYMGLQDEEKMAKYSHRALQLHPQSPIAITQNGIYHLLKGDRNKAVECFNKALKINPMYAAAYWNLANAEPKPPEESRFQQMVKLLESDKLDTGNKAYMGFALANAYRKRGEISKEFECLNFANAIINEQFSWDPNETRRGAANLISVTNNNFVSRFKDYRIDSFSPIVIATLPRSGSTLLEQILASHSEVKSYGETDCFYRWFNDSADKMPKGKAFDEFSDEDLAHYVERSHKLIQSGFGNPNKSSRRIIDKSLTNYTEIGKILSIYPNAKIIYLHRHPMAIALSCYQYLFTSSNPFTYKLENIATAYQTFTLLMNHWEKLFPNNVLRVDYEELTETQEKITRNVLRFCELEWEDGCLSFQDNKQMVFTASTVQVRRAINTDANERWKQYSEYLKPVSEVLKL
jgi:tetratricopeptide (TPR) repeat protein